MSGIPHAIASNLAQPGVIGNGLGDLQAQKTITGRARQQSQEGGEAGAAADARNKALAQEEKSIGRIAVPAF